MTTWTTPKTWAANDPLTHTDMNTYLRDNSLFLKTRAYGAGTVAGAAINSITPAAITGLSVTLTTTGDNVLMVFCSSLSSATAISTVGWRFMIDGALEKSISGFHTTGAGLNTPMFAWHMTTTPPSAGSHLYQVYWANDGTHTITLSTNTTHLYVTEMF